MRIVKFCSSCDEGFAEKWQVCPNCGAFLVAFQMKPVEASTGEPVTVDAPDYEEEAPFRESDELPISDDEMNRDPYVVVYTLVLNGYKIVAGVLGLVVIVLLFAKGFEWYWDRLYPILAIGLTLPIILTLPVGLVTAIFRRTRGIAGIALLMAILAFFSANWLQALGYAYIYAGKVWMVIGFLLAGIGVFAIATIGALIVGEFYNAVMIVVTVAICWIVFILSSALVGANAARRIKLTRAEESGIGSVTPPPPPKFGQEHERLRQEDRYDALESEYEVEDDEEEEFDIRNDEEIESEIQRLKSEVRAIEAKKAALEEKFFESISDIVGDSNTAKEVMQEVFFEAELEPGSPEYFTQQAHILWKEGKRERALLFFNKALPEDRDEIWTRDDAITVMNRGNLQIELGNFEESILDLDCAAAIDSSLPTFNSQVLKILRPEDREGLRQSMLNKDGDES